LERKVLERIILSLLDSYKLSPEQIDRKVAAVWYSTRGSEEAGMSADETADWVKQLHGVRTGRIEFLQKCLTQLTRRNQGPFSLTVPVQNAEGLMTALNDHRLLLAAHHDIGETEMALRSFAAMSKLPPDQQAALCEIEFLAYIIDELLQLLQGSA
jgi:hypothetical protein